ncbi:MAG: SRPBCC domain-containing protein [Ferruginibacter sp.]
METKKIMKTIEIEAPKENVWKVLHEDQFTRAWYAEFCEGTHAETDWQPGSKAIFKDNSNNGIVGKIIDNRPNEYLAIEYDGMIVNDIEDYESEWAKTVQGSRETYQLTGQNGATELNISCDMAESHFEEMSVAWDKALLKIKTMAEGLQN